jgi:nucleoside-diphosphate-sugar epimerase
MRVLVTGSTGFIGSNLVKRLGSDAIIADRDFFNLNWKQLGKVDSLIHLAAAVRQDNPFINYHAALKLFQDAIRNGCRRIVYASSTAVYGNSSCPFVEGRGEEPLNGYGKSKLDLDREAATLDADITGLRFCNVWGGPGDMIYYISQTPEPEVFSFGEQKRDYVHVHDAVDFLVSASGFYGKNVLNCASGTSYSFNEIAEMLGKDGKLKYKGLPPADFQTKVICDITLMEKFFKKRPRTLKEVIKE